jgi:hypothetical protein
MPKVARAHVAYRYEPYQADAYDEVDDNGTVNLDTAVPVPAPRKLHWPTILANVPTGHTAARRLILAEYLDLFIDGDHPVEYRNGRLCFKLRDPRPCTEQAQEWLCLTIGRANGTVSLAAYRQAGRDLGYSLDGFNELHLNGTHACFSRELTNKGKVVADQCPVWLLQ